jgi:hypothetical protein
MSHFSSPSKNKLLTALILTTFVLSYQNCSRGFEAISSSSAPLEFASSEPILPNVTAPVPTTDSVVTTPPAVVTIAAASGTYQNAFPENVLNADPAAGWNSGGGAPQSITFDLGRTLSLNQVSLVVSQNPASCATRHEFFGGQDQGHLQYLGSLEGTTQNGQTIALSFQTGLPQLRYLQVLTTQSCSWVAWGKIRFQTSAPRASEPNYYVGYFANAIGDDYLAPLRDHNNTMWMTSENAVSFLSKMQAYGSMHAVIGVSNLFFDGNFNLRPDYAQTWAAFAPTVAPYINEIASFYPLDEPFMNGAAHGVPQATMKRNLETVIATMKASFPGKPAAVIFSVGEIRGASDIGPFVIPDGFDWVGYDCYGRWDKCGDLSIPAMYDILKAAMRPNQRLIVVGDGVLLDETPSALRFIPDELILIERLKNEYAFFINEPRAIGFFPFIWWSAPGSQGWTGTADMPLLLPEMRKYSKAILDRNSVPAH